MKIGLCIVTPARPDKPGESKNSTFHKGQIGIYNMDSGSETEMTQLGYFRNYYLLSRLYPITFFPYNEFNKTRMRATAMKTALIIILTAILTGGGGGYFAYTTAYSTALAAGTTAGQDAGYKQGLAEGQITGNSTGYIKGKEEGLAAGQKLGYATGIATAQGTSYKLYDPTLAEVKEFLANDTTDKITYNELTYVCTHYARDVINNAVKKGIRVAYVETRFTEMGHSLLAFETTDKGLVYFDPQYDNEVRPVLGKPYWQCMIPTDDGTTFSAPTFDDTIRDILVIW
jgi:hypothetical protein